METINNIEGMEKLKGQINAAQAEIKIDIAPSLNFPPWWRLDLFIFNEYVQHAFQEVCDHNNKVYATYLPEEIRVSDSVAFHLAAHMTDIKEKMSDIKKASKPPRAKNLPARAFAHIGHLLTHAFKADNYKAQVAQTWRELDPVLWRYLLTRQDEEFVLKRGAWANIVPAHIQLQTPSSTLHCLSVTNVGIDPALAEAGTLKDRAATHPYRPELKLQLIDEGITGMTRSFAL